MPEIATQYEQHNHLTDLADDNAVRRAAAEVAAVLRERVLLVANGAAAAQIESEAHRSCRDDGVVVDGSLSNHINRSTSGGNTDDDLSADANVLLGKVCVVHCAGVHTKDSIGSLASLASLPSNSSSSRNAIGSRDGSESGVEAMQRTFQVNVVSPALLTSSLLPSMGTGSSVVYVGSTLSEIGVPGHLSYVVCLYIFPFKISFVACLVNTFKAFTACTDLHHKPNLYSIDYLMPVDSSSFPFVDVFFSCVSMSF